MFDVTGRKVATLVDEFKPQGEFVVQWNTHEVASGVYFYLLQAGSLVDMKKVVLVE